MKTKLSKELQKYYTRKGNMVIFVNKMTLNQLALTMWERLGYQGIDASVISRVLKGERLFTFRQLDIFCELNGILKQKKRVLKEVLLMDFGKRFKIEESLFITKDDLFVELVKDNLKKIREVKINDQTILAEEWGEVITESVQDRLNKGVREDREILILKLLGDILLERIDTLQLIAGVEKDFVLQKTLISTVRGIAKLIRDDEIARIANYEEAANNYIQQKYKKVVIDYKNYTNLNVVQSKKCVWLRAAALSRAYLGDLNGFELLRKEMLGILDSCTQEYQCVLLEGIARAQGILGNIVGVESSLESAYEKLKLLDQTDGNKKVLRKIQLIRTELELASLVKYWNRHRLERMANEGLILARNFGYHRHEVKINKNLNKLLN